MSFEIAKQNEDGKHRDELELKDEDLAGGDLPRSASSQEQTSYIIRRVPGIAKDNEINYFPKVVSIGPYHYGKEDLMNVQKLKLEFARDLFADQEQHKLQYLKRKLGEPDTLKMLRSYYESELIKDFTDTAFTGMMLLDGCFVLYYILLISGNRRFRTKRTLTNIQRSSIRQDLFLLENQIPFKVLVLVMNHMNEDHQKKIQEFIVDTIISPQRGQKWRLGYRTKQQNVVFDMDLKNAEVHHLLHLLRLNLILKDQPYDADSSGTPHPLPTVKELMDAGIHFKPIDETTSLCQIVIQSRWWPRPWSATVRLPPMVVHGSTKHLCLNLIAYEASSVKQDMWVTSYVWLLNSLIAEPEDVKALRDAGVIEDSQGSSCSEDDVRKAIKEIAVGLVPDNLAYSEAKRKIHEAYEKFRGFNTPISQFRAKYFNSPWSFLALVGAVLALFLTAAQTYFTVWSPKGECDDLCKLLKINHHL